MSEQTQPIVLCELHPERRRRIEDLATALERVAPKLASPGMTEGEFWESGIFHAAVEKLRGVRVATIAEKRSFVESVLNHLKARGHIVEWGFRGSRERHDYELSMPNGRTSVIEAKGCLDGNNTTIFERPANADEFVIWSLCQNPGADPGRNAWSGIHVRLGPEIVSRRQIVNGVVIWDMLCGTLKRPCPKLQGDWSRGTDIGAGHPVPPPCIYLLPRSVPDPRNNERPPCTELRDSPLLNALAAAFGTNASDIVSVSIEARASGRDVQRRTVLVRDGVKIRSSAWQSIRRAKR